MKPDYEKQKINTISPNTESKYMYIFSTNHKRKIRRPMHLIKQMLIYRVNVCLDQQVLCNFHAIDWIKTTNRNNQDKRIKTDGFKENTGGWRDISEIIV